MHSTPTLSRRTFLRCLCFGCLSAEVVLDQAAAEAQTKTRDSPRQKLRPVDYGQVELFAGLPKSQVNHSIATLLAISDDSMLKPYRERAGLPAPGEDVGGWYDYFAAFDWQKNGERGFAPGHCFGQWLSALARAHATDGGAETKAKVESLVKAYSQCISPLFFKGARFAAYTYDKLVIGLIDAHRYGGCSGALAALEKTTDAVLPYLPDRVEDRETLRPGLDVSYSWDELYTLPENLFIAYNEGAGDRYLALAKRFLLDRTYFEPLAAGQDVLTGKHAYSYVNALGSAMQAYLTLGSDMHLKAAQNAFAMIQKDQSFATGGWGPDELFQKPGTGGLGLSLEKSHNSFETPCGAYAHLKLTNYLTCVSGDSRFGDSSEQIIYNTVLGAKPLEPDGRAFYYSDYNNVGKKVYSTHTCPCCAGTLPQVACDYAKHAYFLDDQGVYVNLYLNSALRWQHQGRTITLRQTSDYPKKGKIVFVVETKDPSSFAVRLRIPAWAPADDVAVRVNDQLMDGKGSVVGANGSVVAAKGPQAATVKSGAFVALERSWHNGDRIELTLPLPLRLEKVDDQHPDLVALVCGPRVLFAVSDGAPDSKLEQALTRAQLLSAREHGDLDQWAVDCGEGGVMRFLPFTAIADQTYRTYLKVSGVSP
jgi:hypothetical protein